VEKRCPNALLPQRRKGLAGGAQRRLMAPDEDAPRSQPQPASARRRSQHRRRRGVMGIKYVAFSWTGSVALFSDAMERVSSTC